MTEQTQERAPTHVELDPNHEDTIVRFCNLMIRQGVRAMSVLMLLIILFAIIDAAFTTYQKVVAPPVMILEVSDLLAVFTDGYPDSTPDGDRFLEAEVQDQLIRDHKLPLTEIRARLDRTVNEFVGQAGPSDDRTLMLVRRN